MALAFVAAVAGATVVGPLLSRATLHWVAGRAVGTLLGRTPGRDERTGVTASCQRCARSLEVALPGPLGLLPWAVASGRCRVCGVPRPRWLALVELVTGALFGLAALRLGWSVELPVVLALFAGLVAISAVDLVCLRIPTGFVRATALAVLVTIAAAAALSGPASSLAGAAAGAAVYGGFLWAVYRLSPAMLGFGDVRLGALIGGVVGWLAWVPDRPFGGPLAGVTAAAFVAGLVGTLVGAVLLVVRGRNQPFAFGPAMAVGAVVVILLLPAEM